MFMMNAKVMSDKEYNGWLRLILNPQKDLTVLPFLFHNVILTYAANGIQDINLERRIADYMLNTYSDEEITAISEEIEYANACNAYDFKNDAKASRCLNSIALTIILASLPNVNDIDGEEDIIDVESTELLVDSEMNPVQ